VLGIDQHQKATRVSELDSIVLANLIIGGVGFYKARKREDFIPNKLDLLLSGRCR
jgi:hypothetical protein